MTDDIEYTVRKDTETLHVYPTPRGTHTGIVHDFVDEGTLVGEISVPAVFKLSLYAFHVRDREDFGRFKITKMQNHKTRGWEIKEEVVINGFQLQQIEQFLSLISSLDLSDTGRAKLKLENLDLQTVGSLLSSDQGPKLLAELAQDPDLGRDIFAVASKKEALKEFKSILASDTPEKIWQDFFEKNPWIFGHGLNYVFNDKVNEKLESTTTGHAFDTNGKRIDALMKTRAEISQYVLVEIKKANTALLKPVKEPYRPGCWQISDELAGAITQVQKTKFEFTKSRFKDLLKDSQGNELGNSVYAVEPKSYLVIGNLKELADNDDKFACFELLRRNTMSPDILTFDELYERAKCIVENISHPLD